MFKAVLFDLDGTLGDTLPLCVSAFHRAMEPMLGRSLTDEEILATFGPSEEGTVTILLETDERFRRLPPEERRVREEEALDAYLRWYRELHSTFSPRPFEGMVELLHRLKAAGIVLGLVTGKGPKSCAISLAEYGIADLFDQVETGSPAMLDKPAGIRRILDRRGIRPEEAVYVGDMPSDIRAARSVGMEPLAAAWASTARRDDLLQENPPAVIDTVADLARRLFPCKET